MLIQHYFETHTRIETDDDHTCTILERTELRCLYIDTTCTHDCEDVCPDCCDCQICCRCCPGEG